MYEIVMCLRVNDIFNVLNCSNMSILQRKCFLDTDAKGSMPENCIGMNYRKGPGFHGERLVFARHLGLAETGLFKKPKVVLGGRSVESKEDNEPL